MAQNHLHIPPLAITQQYMSDRVRISDEKYEKFKEYSLRKRLENFNYTSTSNRHNGIPRTKNARDRILDARYDADTQQQLI